MADDKEVQFHRERLAGKSRADLIHEQSRWQPYTPQVIAANQLLDEMDSADEAKRHSEGLAVSSQANRLSRFAIGIAVLALAVAGFQALLQWHDSLAPKSAAIAPISPLPLSSLQPTGSVQLAIAAISNTPTSSRLLGYTNP